MRSIAYKVKIEDLVHGQYVRGAEGEPSHLLTPWGQWPLRARVMATVVEKNIREDQTYGSLRLDDGTETIRVKVWKQDVPVIADVNVGDLVDVIGRVREYEGEIYLVPEVIVRVEDPNWELVRELEILKTRRQLVAEGKRPKLKPKVEPETGKLEIEVPEAPRETEPIIEAIEELEEEPLPKVPDEVKKKVLLAFEKLDKGEGAGPTDLAAELDMSVAGIDDALRVLIAEGEIFEPKPGRFKRLR